jgi:hypothetical protein
MSSSPVSKIESLEASIRDASKDSVITCSALRKIAEENGATYLEAGDAADRLDIKIRECELGCF